MTAENVNITPRASEGMRPASRWSYRPRIDVIEDTAGFTICADMPGASADTIKMTFADGLLAVHAQVPPRPHATPDYLTHEFGVGDFDCQLSVSDAIEADGINASYERGVLTIRLPKRDEIKPRRIPVRDAQGTQ